MTKFTEELKQAIWRYVDGELDTAKEHELVAMASENEIIAQAIPANQNFDCLLISANHRNWMNKLIVEHNKGAFVMHIDVQAAGHGKIAIAEKRSYQNVSDCEADLEKLCKATVSGLQDKEQ